MKKMLRLVLLLGCALWLTGCASIVDGGKAEVPMTGTLGATVSITDEGNAVVFEGKLPATAELVRGGGFQSKRYTVEVSKPNYVSKKLKLAPELNNWVWGNILLGGVIGVIVDASTGAMWTLTPESLSVQLQPVTGFEPATEPAKIAQGTSKVAINKNDLFRSPLPAGFAKIEELDKAPINSEHKEKMERYVQNKSEQKAFVIGWKGGFFSTTDVSLAGLHATFERCHKSNSECWLYGLGNEVVWSENKSSRITQDKLQPLSAVN